MTEYSLAIKIVEGLGTTGLIIFVVWKLVDRWAGQFLGAQKEQTTAMCDQAKAMAALASAVGAGQGEQRELLIAVRVLAGKVDETKAWVKELSEYMTGCSARQSQAEACAACTAGKRPAA